MYSKEEVAEGIILYFKKELIPILPNSAKFAIGSVLIHNSPRILELLGSNSISVFDIINKEGTIDVDVWISDLKQSMDEFCGGKLEIQLPLSSKITLCSQDIDTLKRYIKGELR